MDNQKPSIGRIVHYKISDYDLQLGLANNGAKVGECLPAIVTNAHDGESVNVQIFGDSQANIVWKEAVKPGDKPGEYHWPERV